EVAPVGAIVAVISGDRASAQGPSTSAISSPKYQQSSTAPTTSSGVIAPATTAAAPIKLDPFLEVRTPTRNYGPERLPGGPVVTPLARRLAAESGISLERVRGSGPRGRIVARDIEAARAQGVRPAATPSPQHAAEVVRAIYRDRPFEEVLLDAM